MQNSTENTQFSEEFKDTHICTVTTVQLEVFDKVTFPSAILCDSGIYSWSRHKSSHWHFTFDVLLSSGKEKTYNLPLILTKSLYESHHCSCFNWEVLILLKILSCPLAFKINMSWWVISLSTPHALYTARLWGQPLDIPSVCSAATKRTPGILQWGYDVGFSIVFFINIYYNCLCY